MKLPQIRFGFHVLCVFVVLIIVLHQWEFKNGTLDRLISPVWSQSEESDGERTNATRTYIRMKYGPVFILDVVGGNSSENASWDHFRIYGVLDKAVYKKEKIRCCLMYRDKNSIVTLQTEAISERRFSVPAALWRFHVGCPNVKHAQGHIPIGLSVTILSNVTCTENHVTYVKPYFPFKKPDTIVIGSKFAFGDVSAELIIEWIEAMRYIGVDKIVTYYLKTLNEEARKVLHHYASKGIVDLYFHELANEDVYPRVDNYNAPKHAGQHWNDESAIVFDSFERNSGCRYFGIIDYDEFIIPGKYMTLRETFDRLDEKHIRLAGFMFRSQYFFLSWGKSSNTSDLIIDSYIMREDEEPRFDHPKGFQIPDRVAIGGTETHSVTPANGFEVKYLPIEEGYIRHYRNCRRQNYRECMTKTKRIRDTGVSEWAEGFREKVFAVRKQVLGL